MEHKYGCYHSLDNKVMNLYLRVSQRMRSTSQIILLYFQRGWSNVLTLLFLNKLKW